MRLAFIILATLAGLTACAGASSRTIPATTTTGGPDDIAWLEFTGDGFSLDYPPAGDVAPEGENLTRFRFLGPDSLPNTEITDGFTVTVGRHRDAVSAEDFARERSTRAAEFGEVLDAVRRVDFQGRTAYRFRASTLGTATTLVVPAGDGGPEEGVIEIVWNIADPAGRGYAAMVERMVESLDLEPMAPPGV